MNWKTYHPTIFSPTNDAENVDTSVTLKTEYGDYSVSVKKTGLDIHEVMDELIKPLLLAAGYHPNNINDYFDL